MHPSILRGTIEGKTGNGGNGGSQAGLAEDSVSCGDPDADSKPGDEPSMDADALRSAAVSPHPFPALRWLAVVWLAVYLPSYSVAYGFWNFLFLCNLGIAVTAAALIAGSRLLVSSQAIAAPVIGIAWTLDVGWRLVTGDFLFGGTAYMWDPQYPLFTRLLSLYHVAWPILVVACVRRVGYDRRGWPLQTAIAAAGIVGARWLTSPAENVNFAYRDPLFGVQIGPAAVHVAVVLAVLAGIGYGLTHAILSRAFGNPPDAS